MHTNPFPAALAALVIALGAATAVGSASAQTAGGPAAATAASERPSRIEGRIAFLKAEMKVTDAQNAPWNAVTSVMRQNDRATRDLFRQFRESRDKPMSAIARLEWRERFASARTDSARNFLAAFRPLYESMSADQKRSADELLAHRGGRPGGRGEHGGRL
jgi:hypothetical protein